PDTIPRHKSGKARIEAPMREARSSHRPHNEALGSSAQMRCVLILRETSDGQERKQDSEDDPNTNAHQSSPAARFGALNSVTCRARNRMGGPCDRCYRRLGSA